MEYVRNGAQILKLTNMRPINSAKVLRRYIGFQTSKVGFRINARAGNILAPRLKTLGIGHCFHWHLSTRFESQFVDGALLGSHLLFWVKLFDSSLPALLYRP
jgi:hypothetical protein